ncbi:hypothetical protein Moror_4032 [Moniliophthora roreri MCA 2997]|uniref:Reverse transcriptase-rnase h-integrase n=1 Tax=Moniliophthora roreri (strain MCA 2997) TaxID=1381753 RepID=V2YU83_MONRO|nr:hypothetical protein Moror_4032 [Moniliophthora roreri MCA 2997]
MVMFFGLSNSPATFQSFMDDIFSDYLEEGWVVIYMDDILIFSSDQKTHQKRTIQILERLRLHDLFLKPEKCKFDVTEIDFLGMIIRPGYIGMDPVKLAGIRDWKPPTTVRGVRSFLGFGNFYRKFIRRFSEIAKPLNELTKKDKKFEWTTKCQLAFDTLKEKFLSEPVLIMPDTEKPFLIECDASKWATGAVLRQQGTDGEWHPCGYISHSLTPTERNYEIYDREMFSIVRALMSWRHYLMGGKHPITILSDHKNLMFFKDAQKLNRRQARWSLFLSQFDLQLVHTPGTKMTQSDALSRRPDHVDDNENDNNNVVMLPDKFFLRAMDVKLHNDLIENLKGETLYDDAMRTILKEGPPPIKSALEDWTTRDGLLFYKNRCYVPNKGNLRREIVKTIHEAKGVGHPGQFNTLEQVSRDYWWPGMAKFVKMFVDGCAKCQESKTITHPNKPPLLPIEGEKDVLPFSKITMDLITDLPESGGYDTILVVVDHSSTKGVIFTPCNKTIDAEQTATLLLNNVYKRFGLPNKIISDRDPRFAAKVFQELGKQLGVKHMMSTAFHPQTDGESERVNQELEVFLRLFCSRQQDKWAEFLPFTEFAHNNRTHSTMKKSPFYLMMGYNPRPLPTVFTKTTIPSIEARLSVLKKLREETYSLMELARRKMENTTKRTFTPFTVGQKVWLEGKNLNFGYPSKKLAPKREGPFKIEMVLGPVTYKLALPEQWKVHPVFHAALLSPYRRNEVHGRNFLKPPPDLVEGQEEHEVEAIIGHTPKRKPQRFLVSWKGYPSAENEWLWEEDFEHAKETLADYKKANKLRSILTKTTLSKCLNHSPTKTFAQPQPNSFTCSITPLIEPGSLKQPEASPSSTISSGTTNTSSANTNTLTN